MDIATFVGSYHLLMLDALLPLRPPCVTPTQQHQESKTPPLKKGPFARDVKRMVGLTNQILFHLRLVYFKLKYKFFPLMYIINNCWLLIDGSTAGDGFSQGKCPSRNCLSNGYCNVCGLISGYAEGCVVTSVTPVCDADSATNGIQLLEFPAASEKVGQCVSCKQSGKPVWRLFSNHNVCQNMKYFT